MPPITCSATDRDKGRLFICAEPLRHEPPHRDGEHEWRDQEQRGGDERVFTR